jgi:transposase
VVGAVSGAKLFFMPKYSPDLNPIEQVFANSARPPRCALAMSG